MAVNRLRGTAVIGVVLALIGISGLVAAPTAAARPAPPPNVLGDQTVPVYSYADAIRESVWVRSPVASDTSGQPDRIAVDIVRPREAAQAHRRVPVIMEASPYFNCCGRGNENQLKTYDANGMIASVPLYYDNYFVPRGYAFVAVDLAGTNRSTGCVAVGGASEVLGAKAVIDWLNGRAKAFHADGTPAYADWTTGAVGMIGKSWDGTIANGVAATGVAGLRTIVPISSISSWYDYTRFNGVLRTRQYVNFLAGFVGDRPASACGSVIAAEQTASDDTTGDFNGFWQSRDYRLSVDKVRASVFVVHGINDQNVTTNQFGRWWDLLAQRGVPRKIWLTQDSHVDPFDIRRAAWVDELHRWFDFWLQGLHNGVMNEPQASIEQPSGQWVDQARWPAPAAHERTIALGNGDGTTGTLGGVAGGTRTFTDNPALSEKLAVANPNTAVSGRLTFLSGTLTHPVRLSGNPSVTLRIMVDKPTTELTAKLVDYGQNTRVDYQNNEGVHNLTTRSCWGSSTTADSACYLDTVENMITSTTFVTARGWLDAAHFRSLTTVTPLQPGTWYTVTVPLDTYDELIPAGHVLGLVLTQSDRRSTSPTPTGATVTVDLAHSSLSLPVAGPGLPRVALPPVVTTTQVPTADPLVVRSLPSPLV